MSRAAPRRRAESSRGLRGRPPRNGGRAADTGRIPAFVELPDPFAVAEPTKPSGTQPAQPALAAVTAGAPARPVALEGPSSPVGIQPDPDHRAPLVAILGWLSAVVAGLVCLGLATASVGPAWLGGIGSVVVATAYTVALAVRIGGRPLVFGALALALGSVVLLVDRVELSTGAAVLTCAVAAVLGVMATVPAARFLHAVRECVIATLVALGGAFAAVGLGPRIAVAPFEYAVLGVAGVGAFLVVYRLGAGLHGLGRRGVVIVLLGGGMLAVSLLYAELLRRYGTPELVESLLDVVRWSREHLGAFPRPLETLLGIPALAWGTHMRARRRQGWWVCMFGVAATASAATVLLNPAITVVEAGLSVGYGVLLGLLFGRAIIWLDLLLTGSAEPVGRTAARTAGRRAARSEASVPALRPEPNRTDPLL